MASAVILAVSPVLASRSTAFASGQRSSRLSWTTVEYEKERVKADQRSRRRDLPGKIEGVSSSEEGD